MSSTAAFTRCAPESALTINEKQAIESMALPGGRVPAATLLIAPALAVLLWLSGAVAAAAAATAMLAVVLVVMLTGSLLLRAAGAAEMPAPAAWVLGCFATSIGVWPSDTPLGSVTAS